MISFRNVTVEIKKKKILENISFYVPAGQITVIAGKNGSGKTTLVSCAAGLQKYSGEIILSCEAFEDRSTKSSVSSAQDPEHAQSAKAAAQEPEHALSAEPSVQEPKHELSAEPSVQEPGHRSLAELSARERARRISFLPQLLPDTSLTVEELTAMGRLPFLDLGKRLTEEDKTEISKALQNTGLTEYKSRTLKSLSGGERQKAFIAMILAQNTELIILDEPTTYMDFENQTDFLRLVSSLKSEHGKTVLMVLHDLTRAVDIADNMVILDSGKKVFSGTSRECTESGIIESTFGVKKSSFIAEGAVKTIFY